MCVWRMLQPIEYLVLLLLLLFLSGVLALNIFFFNKLQCRSMKSDHLIKVVNAVPGSAVRP